MKRLKKSHFMALYAISLFAPDFLSEYGYKRPEKPKIKEIKPKKERIAKPKKIKALKEPKIKEIKPKIIKKRVKSVVLAKNICDNCIFEVETCAATYKDMRITSHNNVKVCVYFQYKESNHVR